MFSSAHEIYGGNVDNNNLWTFFVEDDLEDASGGEAKQTPIEPTSAPQALPTERPLCMDCQKKRGGNQ